MELKILDKKDESLLSRINIKVQANFQGVTPSKEELKRQIASSLKVDENLVVVKNVRVFFGQERAEVTAYQYETEDVLKKIEPKKKDKKGGAAEKTAAEEKKEEAPKEDKKESPKKEKESK